jgi:hypothetical protein
MSLQQQVLADARAASRSDIFRLKAQFSEQRAQQSTDPKSRQDWEELGIEWHMMANLAAAANPGISQTAHQKMTTPEKGRDQAQGSVSGSRTVQQVDHPESVLENDDAWVKSFVQRLSIIIRRIGGRKLS